MNPTRSVRPLTAAAKVNWTHTRFCTPLYEERPFTPLPHRMSAWPPTVVYGALLRSALIANATDRKADGLVAVVPVHVGATAVETAVVSVVAIVLRSAPKVGAEAEIVVVAVVVASGKSRKACCVIDTLFVADYT